MKELDCQSASEIVIFGALGDLSRRKLLPALYQLEACGLINEKSRIVGVARPKHNVEDFIAIVLENLNSFVKEPLDEKVLARFTARLVYQTLDLTDASLYKNLELMSPLDIVNDENVLLNQLVNDKIEILEKIYPHIVFIKNYTSIEIKSNKNAIDRILDNLLTNACKYNNA